MKQWSTLKKLIWLRVTSAVKEYSGAIVTFFTSVAKPLKNLIIHLNPIQDLHGYDHPWPGGGGVNMGYFPPLTNTSEAGVSYSIIDDEKLKINGTATGTSHPYVSNQLTSYDDMPLGPYPAGTYTVIARGFIGQIVNDRIIVSVIDNAGTIIVNAKRISGPSDAVADGTGQAVTFTASNPWKMGIYGVVASGSTVNCEVTLQLNSGSSAEAWSPYSNLCPISGRTGANAYVSPTQDAADATTYPVTWQTEAGTVYSGSMDVVTGALKSRPYYPSYNGETLVGPWVSSMDAYTPGGTPTTGAQVVDLGGVETETQLTAQEVMTLVGTNNVWSDSGDVTVRL